MRLSDYIVAAHNDRGDAGLFRLVYGSGVTPGIETVRYAVGQALRKAGMKTDDGFVIFDSNHPNYSALLKAVSGPSIALDGNADGGESFSADITQHPDFIPR